MYLDSDLQDQCDSLVPLCLRCHGKVSEETSLALKAQSDLCCGNNTERVSSASFFIPRLKRSE